MEKWQEENEKLLAIKNRVLDGGFEATPDEMAEMLMQIYHSAVRLEMRITPLMAATLAEIQYTMRSDRSKTDHDQRLMATLNRILGAENQTCRNPASKCTCKNRQKN